jgi:hypothetical protein
MDMDNSYTMGVWPPRKGTSVRIKVGFKDAGRKGCVIGKPFFSEQWWIPVFWDDAEDPDWFKASGLEREGA